MANVHQASEGQVEKISLLRVLATVLISVIPSVANFLSSSGISLSENCIRTRQDFMSEQLQTPYHVCRAIFPVDRTSPFY